MTGGGSTSPILAPHTSPGMGGVYNVAKSGKYLYPAITPDGQTLAVHQTNVGTQIFRNVNGTYVQQQTLPFTAYNVRFAISDDGATLAAANGYDSVMTKRGVYVFSYANGTYTQTAKLVPPNLLAAGAQSEDSAQYVSLAHDGKTIITPGSGNEDCIFVYTGSGSSWVMEKYDDPYRANGTYGSQGLSQSISGNSNYPIYVNAGYTYGLDVRNGPVVLYNLLSGQYVGQIATNRNNNILVAQVTAVAAPYLQVVVINPLAPTPHYYATTATLSLPATYKQWFNNIAVDSTGTRIFVVAAASAYSTTGDLFTFTYSNGSWSAATLLQSGVLDVQVSDDHYMTIEGNSDTFVVRPFP